MAVYYKPIYCNPVTPLLQFVVQFVSTLGKILTDSASRGPSVVERKRKLEGPAAATAVGRRCESVDETWMSSAAWLQLHGIAARRLDFYDVLANAAFRHEDAVLDLKVAPPRQRDHVTDAVCCHCLHTSLCCCSLLAPLKLRPDGAIQICLLLLLLLLLLPRLSSRYAMPADFHRYLLHRALAKLTVHSPKVLRCLRFLEGVRATTSRQGFLDSPSPHTKLHFGWFSRFCTAYQYVQHRDRQPG